MSLDGYEELDHTADLVIRVWGGNFHSLLRQAANGFYALLGVELKTNAVDEIRFGLSKGSHEDILVDFLNELLYISDQKRQALKNFSFMEKKDTVDVHAVGFPINSQIRYIKAATFHNLWVEKTNHGLEATITFDV